jgi:hypothetical protein
MWRREDCQEALQQLRPEQFQALVKMLMVGTRRSEHLKPFER